MKAASVDEASVLGRLVAWGEAEPLIRAMVLTSTRARPNAPVDALSDYDVILFVADAEKLSRDDAWQSIYGQPMVRWGDQKELYGRTIYFRGGVYENGVKIDYGIWPDEIVDVISEQPSLPDRLDVGYRVLLDKGARTSSWKEPTYLAHIPARPTEAEYRALIAVRIGERPPLGQGRAEPCDQPGRARGGFQRVARVHLHSSAQAAGT